MGFGSYYLTFLVGILVHYFLVTIITVISYKIHQKKLTFDAVIHIFSSLVLPEVTLYVISQSMKLNAFLGVQ